jgi:hypothetical protein
MIIMWKPAYIMCSLIFFSLTGYGNLPVDLKESDSLRQAGRAKEDSLYWKDCPQQALGDLFRKKGKDPKPPRKFSALILPNISSNPSNGLLLGVGGSLGWYFGPKTETRVSGAGFTIAVTSKRQVISFIKSNIYTKNNRFFLQGDWRFYIYSQPTYGLGTNAPDTVNIPSSISWQGDNTGDNGLSFPMKFNYVRFLEIVNTKVIDKFYAGVGYALDYYYQINDENLHLDSTPPLVTPHYIYSESYHFNPAQYILSGVSANLIYDTRDNMISPYKGIYANINYRYNFKFLGTDQDESSLWLEFRTYVGLSKRKARNVLAFWAFGDFELTGHMPYLTLPALGEDQRARSGRGYTNGRYRGEQMVYGEVEWRFPISPCSQILGGVLFVNATTASNTQRHIPLFGYIKPAIGVGLRVMVNKYFRTNINLDFAIGVKSKGFYFSGQETF